MRIRFLTILGYAFAAWSVEGCYCSHGLEVLPDAAADAVTDTGAVPPQPDAGPPCIACGAPRVLAQELAPAAVDSTPLALFDVAALGDTVAALIGVLVPDGNGDYSVEYRVLMLRNQTEFAWAAPATSLRTRRDMMAGTLDAQDGALRAAVLSTDFSGPVTVLSATWDSGGALQSERALGTMPPIEPQCGCSRTGGIALDGTGGIAAVADGDLLHTATLDLGLGRIGSTFDQPLSTPMAEDAAAISVALVHSQLLMTVGGEWPTLPSRPATVLIGEAAGPWAARDLLGDALDPAPVVSRMGDTYWVARHVTDDTDSSHSAVHAWNVDSSGAQLSESVFPSTLTPLAVTLLTDGPESWLLWSSQDSGNLAAADLHLGRLDGATSDACSATVAHLPNGIINQDPRALVAVEHGGSIVVVFMEQLATAIQITALELPDCSP